MTEKEYRKEVAALNKVIEELLVIIDTAQVVLKRASISLKKCSPEDHQYVFSNAAKWVMDWKYENNK